ncbi:hypothetical protein M422DRAFT_266427 [Sphaerobolus stellatus SS14]|uniref:Uncharacterized protein n=1 Tax=Sphaerobolus stellatus (strain SS14) TaxID=990650 RepID=A0A0C9TP54_SPHS4|nr:hypothetical protein M422DRAFT_266427 [Sphaerobolus stellatus SS14]
METKIIAAEIATAAGTTTVITTSKNPSNIFQIIEYSTQAEDAQSTVARPPHTVFLPSQTPVRDLKAWTAHTLHPSGTVIIDHGAHQVLSRRDSGGRLLPIGVVDVQGGFASGQAVRIAIRRPKPGTAVDTNTVLYTRQEDSLTRTSNSPSTPGTPALTATISMTTSIASLEPLSRSGSMSDISAASSGLETITEGGEIDSRPKPSSEGDDDKWEIIEVGRGLANYNWVEIRKVKGLKSSYITQLLGYADSEYVVENITIRIPPSIITH